MKSAPRAARITRVKTRPNPAPDLPTHESFYVEEGAYLPLDMLYQLTWYGGQLDATLSYYPKDSEAVFATGKADVYTKPYPRRVVWRASAQVELTAVRGRPLRLNDGQLREVGIAGYQLAVLMWDRMQELVR